MKKYFSCLTVLFILMVSCNLGNHALFPEPVLITTTKSNFDSVYLKYPYRIRMVDSFMYVTNLHGDDYFCHRFEYPSLRYQTSFARKGKAPGEFLSLGNICAGNGKLLLLDVFARKLYQWKDGQMGLQTSFPYEMGMVMDFASYNDSVIIVPGYTGKNRLCFVNTGGKTIRNIGTIPNTRSIKVNDIALAKAWRPFIHYNPGNSIVALATQLGEVLEVYNLQSGQTSVTVGADGEPDCVYQETNARPNGVMGYGDVYVGNRHIYALYWGHKLEDIKNGKITGEGGGLFRLFNLSGKPVRQYQLDCLVTGFNINEDTGKVIATDANNEQLVSFQIPL